MNRHITARHIEHNGVVVAERGEMLSLTDMWRAAGSPSGRAPTDWLALVSSKEFVGCVEASHNAGNPGIMAKKGKGGGTFGHWQIGLAYAKYLDPAFHMKCNAIVRERMEGARHSDAVSVTDLSAEVRKVVGGITKAVIHAELRDAIVSLIPQMVAAQLAEQDFMIRHGKSAGQVWDRYDLPKLKSAAKWFGNRLVEMGCMIEGRGDRGNSAVRLFDPDKADVVMKNGLAHRTKIYVASRQGQGHLRLVQPSSHAVGAH